MWVLELRVPSRRQIRNDKIKKRCIKYGILFSFLLFLIMFFFLYFLFFFYLLLLSLCLFFLHICIFFKKKEPYFDLSNSVYLFFSFSLNLSYPIFVLNNNQLLRDIQVTVILIFCSVKFRKYISGNKTKYMTTDDLPSRIPLMDGLVFFVF